MFARLCSLTAVATLAVRATPALAWNDRGHMIIAALAYEQLDQDVKDRVDALLKLNPQYATWTKGVSATLAREVAFVRAATWPDFIKSASGYVDDGDRPSGPESSQNIGYEDKLQHRYWHYIDLPFSPDGTPLEDPVAPNAETQIEAFRAAIASSETSENVKSYDVVWLLHLVGDVHQPLHATSRFTATQTHGDQGGNKVKVTCSPACGAKNLHAFWDEVLGTSKSAASAIGAARKLAKQGRPTADPMTDIWIRESLQVAESTVYAAPVGSGGGPYKLNGKYQAAAIAMARERARVAGARLAAILATELKGTGSGS